MEFGALSSIRTRLVALILLAFIPVVAWDVYTVSEQRHLAIREAQEHSFRLLQPIDAHYEQVVQGAHQLLIVLARVPAVRAQDSAAASALFANVIKDSKVYADIGAAKPNGEVFASGIPLKKPLSVADQLWFRRALETRDISVGDYQIDPAAKKATINIAYPVLDAAGEVESVVFVAIDLTWLNRIAAKARLPGNSTLTLIDSKGVILVRHPSPERWVGKSISGQGLGRSILSQRIGMIEATGEDGVLRTYAFMPIGNMAPTQQAYLVIGVPSEVVYARANAMMNRDFVLLGIVVLLTSLIVWVGSNRLVLHKITALAEAVNRLGAGNLDTRTGLPYTSDELGQLAHGFDEMAGSIQDLTRLNQSILNSAGEGICGIDLNCNATFVNPAAADMLGRSVEECVGRNFHYLAHHTKPDGTPYPLEECPSCVTIKDGIVQRMPDQVFWRKDGTSFPVEYVGAPIRENDEVTGAVIVFRDVTERMQMEEALRKSEYFLRQVLDATPHITFVIDEQLRILLANAALADFYDVPLAEIVGITQPELHQKLGMPTMELEDWIADNRRALETGPIEFMEYSHNRAGIGAWYRTKKLPLVLSDGTKAVLVISEDISELKDTEEQLRRTNRMLRVLSAVNQVLVRATDESALLQDVCRIITEIGGYRMAWIGFAEQDEEKTVRPVCAAGYNEGYLDAVKFSWADVELGRGPTGTAIRTGEPAFCSDILTDTCYTPWRREAAERGYASSIAVPLMVNGRTLGAISLYADKPGILEAEEVRLLTQLAGDLSYGIMGLRVREERMLAEETLRRSEQRLRLAVEQTPLGVIEWDPDFRVTSWNPAAEQILGYSAAEAKGQHAGFIVPASAKPHVDQVWADLMAKKGGTRSTNENVTKDGRTILCEWYNTPLTMADGTVIGVASLVDDVTEQAMVEQHKRDFYRRTILAATEGKLVICERDEIERTAGPPIWSCDIRPGDDLGAIRRTVFEVAHSAGMDEPRIWDFVLCVGEATTNAIKHAGGGTASLHRAPDGLLFVVSDRGPGIAAINLPEVALKRGYTTAVSLGMGYKAMISLADRVYLATGPTGTTVGLEMKLHAPEMPSAFAGLPETW